jgi:hypothetical protein
MKNPICFALDFPSITDAERFVYEHNLEDVERSMMQYLGIAHA